MDEKKYCTAIYIENYFEEKHRNKKPFISTNFIEAWYKLLTHPLFYFLK